jgi:hypothetical protein
MESKYMLCMDINDALNRMKLNMPGACGADDCFSQILIFISTCPSTYNEIKEGFENRSFFDEMSTYVNDYRVTIALFEHITSNLQSHLDYLLSIRLIGKIEYST